MRHYAAVKAACFSRPSPVPPRNTPRDMDVQELGSPGHPRSNRALSCVAFSKKRKCAPLTWSLSGPETAERESSREMVLGVRERGSSEQQQEPADI